MATITQILADKETSAESKLESLQAVVAKARKAYGNEDEHITIPTVRTANGSADIKYLTVDDKVAAASQEVSNIARHVIAMCEVEEGTVFDNEMARGIALSPILCNLGASTGSEYL